MPARRGRALGVAAIAAWGVTACGAGDPGAGGAPVAAVPVASLPEAAGPGEGSAASAALAVAVLGEEAFYAEAATLDDLLEGWVDPSFRDEFESELVSTLNPVRHQLAGAPFPAPTWFAVAPLTVEVVTFNRGAGSAVVEVWTVHVFSRDGVANPVSNFLTYRIGLRWSPTASRWLVERLDTLPGPAAELHMGVLGSTAGELDAQLDGHRLLHELDLAGDSAGEGFGGR